MIVYKIGSDRYFKGTLVIPDGQSGIPAGTTRTATPELANGEYAIWMGSKWMKTTTPPEDIPAPAPIKANTIVSMRKARLALFNAGYLHSVQDAIDQLPEPDRTVANINWEYASEVHRLSPWVTQLTQALGMTEAQVDDLFAQALSLPD
jgi:hypothetical protein